MDKIFDFAAKTHFSVDVGGLTPIYVVEQEGKRLFVSSADGCSKEGEKYVFPSHCEYAVGRELYRDTYPTLFNEAAEEVPLELVAKEYGVTLWQD